MEKVRIKVEELRPIIETNRLQHLDAVREAQVEFRRQAIERLDEMLKDAQDGRAIRTRVDLVVPKSYLEEYDRALAMLDLSVDDVVELDEHRFQQLVQDDWDWKGQFIAANSPYTDKAK